MLRCPYQRPSSETYLSNVPVWRHWKEELNSMNKLHRIKKAPLDEALAV